MFPLRGSLLLLLTAAAPAATDIPALEQLVADGRCAEATSPLQAVKMETLKPWEAAWVLGLRAACSGEAGTGEQASLEQALEEVCREPVVDCHRGLGWAKVGWVAEAKRDYQPVYISWLVAAAVEEELGKIQVPEGKEALSKRLKALGIAANREPGAEFVSGFATLRDDSRNSGRYQLSLRYAEGVVQAAGRLSDTAIRAEWLWEGLHELAFLQHMRGKLEAAVVGFDRAFLAASSITDPVRKALALARSHNDRAVLLDSMGRLEEALAGFDQALLVATNIADPGERALAFAKSYHNRATLLAKMGRQKEALAGFEQTVLNAANIADPISKARLMAASHHAGALLLDSMGRQEEALKGYDQALLVTTSIADLGDRANAQTFSHLSKAVLLQSMGKPEEALAELDQALLAVSGIANPGERARALSHSQLVRAALLKSMGRQEEALKEYDQALLCSASIADPGERANAQALSYHNRATLLESMGRQEEALAGYDQALSAATNITDSGQKARDLAATQLSRATLLARMGEQEEALAGLDQALQTTTNIAVPGEKANILANLHLNRARLLDSMGRQEEALAGNNQAFLAATNIADPGQKATALTASHLDRALRMAALGRLEEALVEYDLTILATSGITNLGQKANVLSWAHLHRSILFASMGRQEEALAGFDQALQTAMNIADPGERAECLAAYQANRASLLEKMGRQEEALAGLDHALMAAMSIADPGQKAYALALFHQNQASLLNSMGRQEEALARFNHALMAATTIADPGQKAYALAFSHSNRASLLNSMGSQEDALAGYHEALQAATTIAAPGQKAFALAFSHQNRALLLFSVGRLEEALAGLDQALLSAANIADPGQKAYVLAIAHQNRASLLVTIGRQEEAITEFDQALMAATNIMDPGQKALSLAYSRANWAAVLGSMERQEDSVAALDQALMAATNVAAPGEKAIALTLSHHGRALLLATTGRECEALTVLDQAFLAATNIADPGHRARALAASHLLRGELLRSMGRQKEALTSLQEARIALSSFDTDTIDILSLRITVYQQIARLMAADSRDNAVRELQAAYQRSSMLTARMGILQRGSNTQRLKDSLLLNDFSLPLTSRQRAELLLAVDSSQSEPQRPNDLNSSHCLAALTATASARTHGLFPDGQVATEACHSVRTSNMLTLEEQLRQEALPPQPTVDELNRHLRQHNSRLVRLLTFQPNSDDSEAPLHLGALVLNGKDVQWLDLGPDKALARHALALLELWSKRPDSPAGEPQSFGRGRAEATVLRQVLWDKVVGSHTGIVYVVGDGVWQVFPFHALPGASKEYLIQEQELRYLPTMAELVRPRPKGEGGLFALSNPYVDVEAPQHTESKLLSSAELGQSDGLGLVPDQGLSAIEGVVQAYGGFKEYTGREANEQVLREVAPGARLLSIGAHGVVVGNRVGGLRKHAGEHMLLDLRGLVERPSVSLQEIPELASVIYLAGSKREQNLATERKLEKEKARKEGKNVEGLPDVGKRTSNPLRDGFLTAAEVRTLDLSHTELVTLWSCETGTGLETGRELYGFRSAFLAAGAGAVIAPAWSVDLKATSALATSYFKGLRLAHRVGKKDKLKKGESVKDPLTVWRSTVLEWLAAPPREGLQRYQDPFYWAAFLPTGG